MFHNDTDDIYCHKCGRLYFRFAPPNSLFCICHVTIVFSFEGQPIQKEKKISVPKAFYDAFEQEKDF
jgi:hypothetical protein